MTDWWSDMRKWLSAAMAAMLFSASAMPGAAAALSLRTEPTDPATQTRGWMQDTEAPPIEQVGEGSGDAENLDEGARPETEQTSSDEETLDQGAPPGAEEGDVETLDEGSPPGTAVETTAGSPPSIEVAPAPSSTVASEPSGPVLPPGFGTGRVRAVAGHSEVPPGLEPCHVGVITGRAYVGIECGDSEDPVVGHAATDQDFPFVLESDFPFEDGDSFTESVFRNEESRSDDVEVIAAARVDVAGFFADEEEAFPLEGIFESSFFADDEIVLPVIQTSGSSSVELAQQVRERKPRVRAKQTRVEQSVGKSKSKKRAKSAKADDNDRGKSAKSAKQRDNRHHGNGGGKRNKKDKHQSAGKNDKKGKQNNGKKKGSKKNRK